MITLIFRTKKEKMDEQYNPIKLFMKGHRFIELKKEDKEKLN